MLHDGAVAAVDDGVILRVLQQDTHDGGLGDVGVELVGHAAVGVGIHHVVGEAGAVVVVGIQQALLLQRGGDVDGGPRRQIAALAMAGDA